MTAVLTTRESISRETIDDLDDQLVVSEICAGAETVRAVAAQHAADHETTRALHPEVIEALRTAGFSRHFVSHWFGGAEGSFTDLTQAVMTVGRGCASTAWCASLAALSSRFATHLPRAGQHLIWGADPDALVVAGLPPTGRATRVPGGYRLTGRWGYVSGVDLADWVLLCGVVHDGDAVGTRFFALPRAKVTVHPTWDSIGMRATSSHAVSVADEFVAADLTFDRAEMMTGRNSSSSDVDTHNVPFQAVGGLTFVAPVVGAALGAVDTFATMSAGRDLSLTTAVAFVRASGHIDAARALVEQNAAVLDERRFTPELMARNERNAAVAAELVADAVGDLLKPLGTYGFGESSALQRTWRDVSAAGSHVALRYETATVRTVPAAYGLTTAVPPRPGGPPSGT